MSQAQTGQALMPFRGFGTVGILHDPSPYDLPPEAFSGGINVRFSNQRASRAPIWRNVETLPTTPAFCSLIPGTTGYDQIVVADTTGRLWIDLANSTTEASPFTVTTPVITAGGSGYSSSTPPAVTFSTPTVAGGRVATGTAVVNSTGSVTGITVTDAGFYPYGSAAPSVTIAAPSSGTQATATTSIAFTPGPVDVQFTSTTLGEVNYINNPNFTPFYLGPANSNYQPMASWDSGWRCQSLRAYKDYLIALNVEKNGVQNPVLVKWSNNTLAGLPPDSWNSNDPTTNAGENPLTDLRTPIVDGAVMRDIFVIYSSTEVWAMQAVTTPEIFNFVQLFSDTGAIAPNCIVEVAGKHYVFGPNDIYVHDGTNKQSLLADRNHGYVYRNLNFSLSDRCFAVHLPRYKEILFAYVSGDPDTYFMSPTGCNRGMLYNYVDNTTSFIELPNITSATVADLQNIYTWNNLPANSTWADFGGSWYGQTDGKAKQVVAVSQSLGTQITANRLIAYDNMDYGELSYPYLDEINSPAYLERIGIDLEPPGTLAMYKLVTRMFPRVTTYRDVPVTVQIGGQLTPSGPVNYLPPIAFDPTTDYKIDLRTGGRYVAVRFSIEAPADFDVTGFDLDVVNNGTR